MRPSERVEVEALRSLFAVPEPRGVLRRGGRRDRHPRGRAADQGAEPDRRAVRPRRAWTSWPESSTAGRTGSRSTPRPGWTTSWSPADTSATAPGRSSSAASRPVDARTDLDVTDARSRRRRLDVPARAWNVPPAEADWLSPCRRPLRLALLHRVRRGRSRSPAGCCSASGGAGWLGVAATRIEYRGRGAQSALLAARIDRARQIGLELVVTETGAPEHGEPGPSYRNILRAGFEPAYVRPNYTASGRGQLLQLRLAPVMRDRPGVERERRRDHDRARGRARRGCPRRSRSRRARDRRRPGRSRSPAR